MTDVVVPVETCWDIVANALDDPWFWFLSIGGMIVITLVLRHTHRRTYRCPYRHS